MPLTQLQATGQPFPPGEPDVQRTSFSLDVLGRFVCSTWDEATANPDFDVVVIGSGMYGSYAAAKIYGESARPGRTPLRILVLEAGPFLVHEHGQNIPDLGLGNPFRPVTDTFGPDAQRTRDLVWGIGWRGNVGFPGTAYCVGGKSIYWGGWCPRLRDGDLQQWPVEVGAYLNGPPDFGSNLPNRLAPADEHSVYQAVEFEIGVHPADDFVFDPVLGPEEPPDRIGLNAALGKRLKAALAALRGSGGTPLGDPEPPPIAVQTQSFVSGVFSPDKFSSLTLLISAIRDAQGRTSGATSQERDLNRRLFLVPNGHVARLEDGEVFRDGALRPGDAVTAVELFADGVRKVLPVKRDCIVVLALGCIEFDAALARVLPHCAGPRRRRADRPQPDGAPPLRLPLPGRPGGLRRLGAAGDRQDAARSAADRELSPPGRHAGRPLPPPGLCLGHRHHRRRARRPGGPALPDAAA